MVFARLPPLSTLKTLKLLCGVFLALLSFPGSTSWAVASDVPTLEESAPIRDKCWIFTHLQKSGGSTVKGILQDSFGARLAIYDSPHWKHGDAYLQSVGQSLVNDNKWDVIAGGYPEALRLSSPVDQNCQWFTVFRHPISRMVSAYYYCQLAPNDTLCGSQIVNAQDVDLNTFAKHWGNFAVRQFVLSQVPVDDVIKYSQTEAAGNSLPSKVKHTRKLTGWYLLKMYLDQQARTSEYVEIPDVAMYEMLQPVQDLLRDRYTVGLLEEFNNTLSLFEAALDMPGVDWHGQYVHQGQRNVDKTFSEEKIATLVEAWTNSEIKRYIQLDIVLYEHAVDVFHQQARAYGLE